jgi:hypothetical protein
MSEGEGVHRAEGLTMPGVLLRIEGLALLAAAVAGYVWLHGPWWLFAVLALAPDLAALGYLLGPRTGSVIYNAVHITLLPGALLALGLLGGNDWLALVALIWLAHIGVDRLAGFGLKYPTAFQDTHFNRV